MNTAATTVYRHVRPLPCLIFVVLVSIAPALPAITPATPVNSEEILAANVAIGRAE